MSDIYIKVTYNTPGHNWPIPIEMEVTNYAIPIIEEGKSWASSSGNNGTWFPLGTGTDGIYDLCFPVQL